MANADEPTESKNAVEQFYIESLSLFGLLNELAGKKLPDPAKWWWTDAGLREGLNVWFDAADRARESAKGDGATVVANLAGIFGARSIFPPNPIDGHSEPPGDKVFQRLARLVRGNPSGFFLREYERRLHELSRAVAMIAVAAGKPATVPTAAIATNIGQQFDESKGDWIGPLPLSQIGKVWNIQNPNRSNVKSRLGNKLRACNDQPHCQQWEVWIAKTDNSERSNRIKKMAKAKNS